VRVASQEDPGLRGSVIDLEPPFGGGVVDALVAQLGLAEPEILLAVRRGRAWVQDFEPVPATQSARLPPRAKPGGCFLVTGGLGDVGFVIGAWLARQGPAKLVLLSRTGLPAREEWTCLLQSPTTPSTLSLRIRKVLVLEQMGAEVIVVPADLTRAGDVEAALGVARERFGRLHGVVHAAGEMGKDTFAPVAFLSREACERQFAPKVHGTIALAEALRGESPEFCLVTSSLSTLLGGAGYAAYAGANCFADAFAAHASRTTGTPWVSVDFDQWQLGGREMGEIARRAVEEGAAMSPEEGLAVVERVLNLRQVSRIVVSVAPLAPRLRFLSTRPSAGPRVKPALEAIEAALAGLGATDAAAVERVSPAGERELVGFASFGAGEQPTVSELRRGLRERLPGGPLPSSFVILDALPRREDGGVDRAALRGLEGTGAGPAGDGDAVPRTGHERLLATLWKEALGIERVGVHDNFFDLGGHSLLSIRVLARLEKATGLRLDPRDMIFQSLRQIAAACDERQAAAGGRAVAR
jgi:NAD(P)-dependent dehydrogenase (short-subunit alcohol dehydrogenase family)